MVVRDGVLRQAQYSVIGQLSGGCTPSGCHSEPTGEESRRLFVAWHLTTSSRPTSRDDTGAWAQEARRSGRERGLCQTRQISPVAGAATLWVISSLPRCQAGGGVPKLCAITSPIARQRGVLPSPAQVLRERG